MVQAVRAGCEGRVVPVLPTWLEVATVFGKAALGRSQELIPGNRTGCPGRWLSHRPWRCSKNRCGTSGYGLVGMVV